MLLWKVTLGTSRDTGPFELCLPLPLATGAPNIGGAVVTRSGLIFVAATTDNACGRFDLLNGRELWRARLAEQFGMRISRDRLLKIAEEYDRIAELPAERQKDST
ncbi:hypothetical protein FXB40_03430 [Bradyrhizobium rifense]|uniref:Pyrrolo-quinoline quinone repeat domain-containing protein n=1 Tax=Bradyrhizobium rifense TaxID=515499 RepID=A0A5D3L010_9BRAD|nr:hypothetical protein [Bradyrhizobium rifense]TYL99176.1 hypothetical protein FXB40_03430 [Bradyrhizobium rifense]